MRTQRQSRVGAHISFAQSSLGPSGLSRSAKSRVQPQPP